MLKFKKVICLTIVLSMMMLVVSCNKDNNNVAKITDEGVKAIVNNKVITKERFDNIINSYKTMTESQYGEGSWDEEISEGKTMGQYYENEVLEGMIMQVLLIEEAEKEGFKATAEELKAEIEQFKTNFNTDEEFQSYLETSKMTINYLEEEIKKEIIMKKFIDEKVDNVEPKDEELKVFYKDMHYGEEVRASHILVKTIEEAKEAIERINNGEKFEDVAKDISIDGTKENGGDLDFFSYPRMVKEFSKAAFSMNIGDVSDPVESQFGFHVIKVTDKRTDETVTFDSSKENLIETYKNNIYVELIERLKSNAKIEK